MGIKNIIAKAGGKAADTVAKLSSLSPEQIEDVQAKRDAYLSEKPDPSDAAAEELTNRFLALCGVEVYNAFLPQIQDIYVPVDKRVEYNGHDFNSDYNIRFFDITKWVSDKEENSLEKLVNVYAVLSNEICNIALVFHRTIEGTKAYLAVSNVMNAESKEDADIFGKRLANAVRGNFPGAEWTSGMGVLPCLNNNDRYSVASISNVPGEKSEKFISQRIEKLLDGNIPDKRSNEYVLVLLATPITDTEERKLHLTDIYSALAPYAAWQTGYTYNEADATNSSATVGINVGASAGMQNGTNRAITDTNGTTNSTSESEGVSVTEGSSHTEGSSKTTSMSAGVSSNTTVSAKPFGVGVDENIGINASTSRSKTKSVSDTIMKNFTKTASKMTGKATSKAISATKGIMQSTNFGLNFGANFARSSSVTATVGKNESITQTYINYNIKHALELLEKQMKRYEESTALGMWDFAAYVLSEDQDVANNVAHSYLALTQGQESYMSHSAINLWRGDMGPRSERAEIICDYLRDLRHPLFGLNPGLLDIHSDLCVYPPLVTATTPLSGKELAYSLNFPKKSVSGLPVIECAEFGRNVVSYNDSDEEKISIGHIFHMNHQENVPVDLSLNSLTSHTFITGSTGSGKSNTIYKLLDEAMSKDVKFLVVEPAKGEYKNIFGNNVNVYGTNQYITPLLKINPFSFPKGIHVLEHIDRLIEIFNVCWPMYAAMPAVLKEAVEKSYEDCGWDLANSKNDFDDSYYPTFADVASNVKNIINSSEYDSENKGAYKGSLLTRLQSLTNGINGIIFSQDEIPNDLLFDENAIIDLSRVGSGETKSLIMGMLVLKLQEYRLSSDIEMNSRLRHITVLEEAHNILKRTSTEQTTEGANLIGKSVEMISNAIAEMRTYGEGFIIADQAPGLVDMAAIRNTNTKIIMRLPDQMDRECVGYAANLNENQIVELAKLPCGVAAIYQNEWIQPVLCKIEKVEKSNNKYSYSYKYNNDPVEGTIKDKIAIAELLSKGNTINQSTLIDDVVPKIKKLKLDASVSVAIIKMLMNPSQKPRMTKLANIYNALFPEITEFVKNAYVESHEPIEWTQSAERAISELGLTEVDAIVRRDMIQCAITYYLMNVVDRIDELKRWSEVGGLR